MNVILFLEYKFFLEANGDLYSEKVINDNYLSRYLDVFDNVVICARKIDGIARDRSFPIKNKRVSFLPLPNYNAGEILKKISLIVKQIDSYLISKLTGIPIKGLIIRGPSSISYLAYKFAKKKHIPYIVEMVINPKNFFYERHGLTDGIKNFIGTIIIVNHTKKLCWNALGVCYVTKHILQKQFPCRSLKKKNNKTFFDAYALDVMISEDNFCNVISPHDNESPFIISHTGWMVGENKGHRTVIDVLRRLVSNGSNCIVKFIGDGPKKKDFIEYAVSLGLKERVIFVGKVDSYKKLQSELISSHLFLFPSRIEGLPRAIVEAMANSLPVISYDNDGIPELISSNCLAHINDVETLVRLCQAFYDNESLRVKVAEKNYIKAHEYKSENFDIARREFFMKFSDRVQ